MIQSYFILPVAYGKHNKKKNKQKKKTSKSKGKQNLEI